MNDKLYWCIYWSLVSISFVIHFLVCYIKKKKLIKKVSDYINELKYENKTQLQEFAKKIINKLKDKENSDNVDSFVECKRIIKEVIKEMI